MKLDAWQRCLDASCLSAGDFEQQLSGPFRRGLRQHPRRGKLSPLWQDLVPIPWSKNGFFHADHEDPGGFLDYHTGTIYPQDAASQLPVALMNVQEGEYILDACAAPGSKTTALALALNDSGCVIASDASPARRKIIRENISRQGLLNVVVTRASLEDLRDSSLMVDAALVDAPCSGHERRSTKQVHKMAKKQLRILEQTADSVRNGGRLVYSTCTMYFEENEEVIELFLKLHDDWVLDPVSVEEVGNDVGITEQGSVRIWPTDLNTEPFFACRLRRRGDATAFIIHTHTERVHPELDFELPSTVFCFRHKQFLLMCNEGSATIDVPIQSRGLLLGEEIDGRIKLNIWAAQSLIERGVVADSVTYADACALWQGESLGARDGSLFLKTEFGAPLGLSKPKELRLALPSRAFRSVQ